MQEGLTSIAVECMSIDGIRAHQRMYKLRTPATPSHEESIPVFLLDTTKIHAWVDGSEI